MAPKTGAPCGKKKKTQVAATKAVEKKKTCPRLPNTALATPGRSLAPGSHRQKQVSRSLKAGLHFPVDRIRRDLKEGRYSQRIGFEAPIYPTTIFEYLATEVLELARHAVKDNNKIHIIPRHVMLGVMCDEGISKMLAGVTIAHNGVLPNIREALVGDGTMQDARKLLTEDAAKSSEKTTKSP